MLGREAVLSQFSQEFDASFSLSDDVILVLGYGIERVIGNEDTNLGDAGTTSPTSVLFDWLGAESSVSPKRPAQPAKPDVRFGLDMRVGDRAMLFLSTAVIVISIRTSSRTTSRDRRPCWN